MRSSKIMADSPVRGRVFVPRHKEEESNRAQRRRLERQMKKSRLAESQKTDDN